MAGTAAGMKRVTPPSCELWSGVRSGDSARPASISPLPTGGIEVEWRSGTTLIAIDVGPDGVLGYLLRTGTGQAAVYDEASAVDEDALLSSIARVLGVHRPHATTGES